MGALHSAFHLLRLQRRFYREEGKINSIRKMKLASLLKYCYNRSPYYHEILNNIGSRPEDFQSPEDLVSFPVLEKETLRDRVEEFFDPEADRRDWISYRSSGSTGIPLDLWYHPSERLRMGFSVTRELLFNGLKPWHRLVNLTEPRHAAPKDRWYHRLGLMNERFLSVYDASHLNLKELRRIRPHVIIGFPSVLMLIGDEMRKENDEPLRPKLLFTLAEVLTPEDRMVLSKQWGVEPIDLYGANEVGHIAFQCPQRAGYHINVDSLHVEILVNGRPAQPGERGEIVVTNFDLRVVPIIRYRVGDIATKEEGTCPCGCRFPLLSQVAGRSDGFLVGEDGKLFSALEVSLLLKLVKGLRQYRIIQKARGKLLVEFASDDPESHPEPEVERTLKERLGPQMQIECRRVAEIPREKSGKIRSVVSYLAHPFWRPEENRLSGPSP